MTHQNRAGCCRHHVPTDPTACLLDLLAEHLDDLLMAVHALALLLQHLLGC